MSKLDIHGQWVGSAEVTYDVSICDSAVFCVECDINEIEVCEIKESSKMDNEPAELPTALIWTIYRTVTGFVVPTHMIKRDSKLTLKFINPPAIVPHMWMHLNNPELSRQSQFTTCKISKTRGTNDIVMPAHVKIVGEYDYLLLSFRGDDEAAYARTMKYTSILKDTADHVIIRWEEPSLWLDIEIAPDVVCYAIHNGSGECAWYPHQRTVLFVQESHYPCCEPSKYTRSHGCKPCSRVLQYVGACKYYNQETLFLNEHPDRDEDECVVAHNVDIGAELSADDKFAIVKLAKKHLTDVIIMGKMKPDMEVLIAFITGQSVEELQEEHNDGNTHFRLGPGCFKVDRTSESFYETGESDSD